MVHLSLASSTGPGDAAALFGALEAVAAPAVNTWGPSDAERLGGIHLDPPLDTGLWPSSRASDYVEHLTVVTRAEQGKRGLAGVRST